MKETLFMINPTIEEVVEAIGRKKMGKMDGSIYIFVPDRKDGSVDPERTPRIREIMGDVTNVAIRRIPFGSLSVTVGDKQVWPVKELEPKKPAAKTD